MGRSAMAAAPVGPGRASGVKGSTVPWRRAGAPSAPRERHARGRRTLGSSVGDDRRHVPDAQVPVRAVAACRHASGPVTPEPVPQSYRAADPRPGTVRADTFRGRPMPSRTRGSRVVTHAWHWRTTARRPDEPARRSRPARSRRSRRSRRSVAPSWPPGRAAVRGRGGRPDRGGLVAPCTTQEARSLALRRIVAEISASLEPDEVFDDVVESSRSMFATDVAGLWLVTPGRHPMQLVAHHDLTPR